MKTNHFLSLSIGIILAIVFTSCSPEKEEKLYYAEIMNGESSFFLPLLDATMESYIFLYPYVTMESGGYFLNEMAKPGFNIDLCSYSINSLSEQVRKECDHNAQLLGASDCLTSCAFSYMDSSIRPYGETAAVKDWLRSNNTPFYNDIVSEIFVNGNSKFLGFYQVNGQEYYIFVRALE